MRPRRTGAAPGSRGCAAPRSASRSAPSPPGAPRCRRSCPTSTERKLSKHPEEFGKGAIEGVAGPEAANNASAAGTLVPLLAIGLPTTATAAVILLAMQSYGIQPGPQLMDTEPELVWALLASLFIANTLLLVLNLPLAPLWAQAAADPAALPVRRHPVLRLARRLQRELPGLRPALLLVFGLLGLAMRRFGIPVLPLIIGVILGPRLEDQLTEALAISSGDVSTLWSEPVGDRGVRRDAHRRCSWPGPGARRARQAPPRGGARRRRPQGEGERMSVVVAYSPDAYGGRPSTTVPPRRCAARPAWSSSTPPGRQPGRRPLRPRGRGPASCRPGSSRPACTVQRAPRRRARHRRRGARAVAEEVRHAWSWSASGHRTPVGKMLLGSVAQRVILDARLPGARGQAGQARLGHGARVVATEQ